jgi:hypothetical protein
MTESNSVNGAMLSPSPPMIEVASGGFVDLLNPDPETIKLEDIGRGLANTCRYGGHIKRFYSVAEHAVLVRDLLRARGAGPNAQCMAVFHDAAEAYLGDVVAPLKWALRHWEWQRDAHSMAPDSTGRVSAYDSLSCIMDAAISKAFNLGLLVYVPEDVQLADMWALRIEARELTATGGASWRWPGELPNDGELPDGVIFHGGLAPDVAFVLWYLAARSALEDLKR